MNTPLYILPLCFCRANTRINERERPSENCTAVQQNRGATEVDSSATNPQYQHLGKDSTPAMAMQPYASLNQPETREYESFNEIT